jgi:prepilin-type processing-associated H-X9-DG protein
MPEGYYPLESIFLLLAFMALARLKSLEELRYQSPGEWGKLLGLDRIPEVRTLRRKVAQLCSQEGRAQRWSGDLCEGWMETDTQSSGVLYADGHVRVYHGSLAHLPKRYVARERLRLRGTTDYWVNAMDGTPFFCVTKAVDPGLIAVLKEELVPRLLKEVPRQPEEAALAADASLSRLTLVFDREGYSPPLFAWLKEQRIAALSYRKFPGEPWPEQEFTLREVTLINKETIPMALAERGVLLSNGLWVREVRRLNGEHQTAIVSTDYHSDLTRVAMAMFARWSQENFFKYMKEHYGLDRLAEYGAEPLPETIRVINPAWRELDSKIRRENALLSKVARKMIAPILPAELPPKKVEAFERKRGELQEAAEHHRALIAQLKEQRKALQKYVTIKDLPEKDRPTQLKFERKHFVDTIKLIAYRAETAMVHLAREKIARHDDARSLICGLFDTEADLIPDHQNQTLTVRLHPLTAQLHDEVLHHLCSELTATETIFPGSTLRLIFENMGSSSFRRDQEF